MKVLKLIKSGLVLHEYFGKRYIHYDGEDGESSYNGEDTIYNGEGGYNGEDIIYDGEQGQPASKDISPLLNVNAKLIHGDKYIKFVNGSISLNVSDYQDLVFESINSFVPTTEGDMGGIRIQRGTEVQRLYEYYDPKNFLGELPYVKVIKRGAKFYGYGSNDGYDWIERGCVQLPCCESMGICAVGNSLYRLDELKVYTDTIVTIGALLPKWRVEVYQGGSYIMSSTADSDKVRLRLPKYPFTGTIKIFDEEDKPIAHHILDDAWGGDEYTCSANVTIYNDEGIPISEIDGRDLGKVHHGIIKARFKVENNNIDQINISLKIAEYSPFGDWVSLSNSEDGDIEKSIDLTVDNEEYFWIHVARPHEIDDSFDYSRNVCLFYLEVF